ncbi:MAG TPA: hypothetical protein VGS80_12120 [Ktedonobacterales bacterium]|nr:hypothetical protein [Ktedonobacterales bacterium]
MQYTCVAIIAARPGHLDEVLRKSELELLPLYREVPGFVAYTVAKTGDSAAIAFSLWQTRQQAEQSIRTSETWMQEGTSGLIDSIKNHVGELPFLAFSRDLSVYASPAATPAGRLV